MHGQFVWYDLLTTDLPAAMKFYPSITGWGTQKWKSPDPGVNYTMWTAGRAPLGGVMPLPADARAMGVPPHWLPYVEVRNIEETLRRARTLGGQVIAEPKDTGSGAFAVLRDPLGAVIAVYHSHDGQTDGFDGTARPGRFSWHELMTTDARRAIEFYRELFGWESTGDYDMGSFTYHTYGMSGKAFGGIFDRQPEMGNVPPFWMCYVQVKDLRKAAAAATKAGAKIVNGPMEVPGGDWIAALMDPQGTAFAMHQAASAAVASSRRKPARTGAKRSTVGTRRAAAKKSASAKSRSGKAKRAAKRKSKSATTRARRSAPRRSARKRSRRR